MSLVSIVFPMPATIQEVVQTIRVMSKLRISYHFDDCAVECLATRYDDTVPPLAEFEAFHIQAVVDRMRTICDAKGIDIFEILLAAEAEQDNTWVENFKFSTPEVRELFA